MMIGREGPVIPVLADVMVPTGRPIMLVNPGYRQPMDTDAVIRGYLDAARQEIARNPRPVLRPSMPVKRPARGTGTPGGGGTVKTGSAVVPPPTVSKPDGLGVASKDTTPPVTPAADQQNFYVVDDQGWVPPKAIPNIRALGAGDYTPGKYAGEVLAGGLLAGAGAMVGPSLYRLYDMYRRTSVIPRLALGSGRALPASRPAPMPTLGTPSGSLPPGSGAIYQTYTASGSGVPIITPYTGSGPVIPLPQLNQTPLTDNATNLARIMRQGSLLDF